MYNTRLRFHFTGIGGSGMSGLAEVLLTLGFAVSGSDIKKSNITNKLEKLGAKIFIGHASEHLPEDASLLVFSSAVTASNPELIEAVRRGIPVLRRAEVLAELMRLKYGVGVAGSHGKTTTTSLIATVLEHGGLDPTVIIGGQVKASGSGSRIGKSDYLVAETDESDRSFLLLKPTIAVVTNIDAEHLQAYASMAELEQSFAQFVAQVPFYGLAVLCIDDRRVRELSERYRGRKVSFGFSPDAELRPVDLVQKRSNTEFTVLRDGKDLCRVSLAIPGRHIISNSLAAVAVGLEFGLDPQTIASGLSNFTGVSRRLEVISEIGGVTVINDYGHHPAEIKATLRAIKEGWGNELKTFHVIFQPHRYSRTRDCFVEFLDCFTDCDHLILTEIYAASEEPIEEISGAKLYEAVIHPAKEYEGNLEAIPKRIISQIMPGDVILCLGAGSVGMLPELIVSELEIRAAQRGEGLQLKTAVHGN